MTFKRNVFAAARLTAIVLTSVTISSVSGNGNARGKGVKPNSNCHKGGGTSFRGAGHVYEVDFGEFSASLNFHSEAEMTFTILTGESIGYSETVQITAHTYPAMRVHGLLDRS